MSDETDAMKAANMVHFLKNGPGLSVGYQLYVVARDPDRGRILIGGLGGQGAGLMWVEEHQKHEKLPGYVTAPIQKEGDAHDLAVVNACVESALLKLPRA